MDISSVRQEFSDLHQGVAHPGLSRRNRTADRFGDLAKAQLPKHLQGHHLPLLRRQVVKDVSRVPAPLRVWLPRRWRCHRFDRTCVAQLRRFCSPASQMVPDAIPGDFEEPRGCTCSAVILPVRCSSKSLEEHVLGNILSLVKVVDTMMDVP